MRRTAPLFVAIGALWIGAAPTRAQAPVPTPIQPRTQPRSRDCDLEFKGVTVGGVGTTHFQSSTTSTGQSNVIAGGGVDGRCANSDQRVTSDSAEHYGDQRLVYLIGRVHYTEARVQLDADRITYHMADERLVAEGNVVGRTTSGTRFKGPRATYLRAKAGLRTGSRLDAGGRPDTWISGTDASNSAKASDSVHVIADSITSDNDSLVYARGMVIIDRPDLMSTADSAMMDQGREFVALRKSPKVVGRGEHKFTLEGAQIDITSRNRQAERVRSSGNAKATSDAMQLEADSIDLRMADQKLSRAVAWGPKGAHAAQSGRDITADSIDVVMPGQVLQSMHAIRRARVESIPDSTKVKSRQRDWFAGDTVVAEFDPPAASDTTGQAALKRLVSRGNAKSWQQGSRAGVTLPDSTPAINYMQGRMITVDFAPDRSLDRLKVFDQVTGVLVQPASDTTKAKPAPVAPKKPGAGAAARGPT